MNGCVTKFRMDYIASRWGELGCFTDDPLSGYLVYLDVDQMNV